MARTLEEAEQLIRLYEQNGAAKLFYSLQRKMNEMADLFNKNNLSNIPLDDVKDKSFDRLFKLLEKSEIVSRAVVALGAVAGITNDEEVDTNKSTFKRITTPESIADHVGELAGQSSI